MPSLTEDYFVNTPRREENISNLASIVRENAKIVGWWKVNMVSFIETTLPRTRFKSKIHSREQTRTPTIIFLQEEHGKEAFVVFKPKLELHVKKSVWEKARRGEPQATFILAHELGHLLMHGEETKGFLATPELRQKHSIEHSAEWQADTFAKYFLLPDNILFELLNRYHNDANEISENSSTPLYWVLERISEFHETGLRKERIQNSNSAQHDFEENILEPVS